MPSTSDEYVTVRLPKELMDEVDEMIKKGVRGYKSRAEFIKEAIRKRTAAKKRKVGIAVRNIKTSTRPIFQLFCMTV